DNLSLGWQSRAPMLLARNHLGAVSFGGKIYAIGGQLGDSEDSTNVTEVDRYDPASDSWTKVASLPAPRSHLLGNTIATSSGKIITIGGEIAHNSITSQVLQYDPQLNQWTTLTPLPAPRRAAASGLINSRIITTGGYDGSVQQRNTWISSTVQ